MTRDYKPVVTHVSNKNGDDVTSDIVLPGEFESPKSKKGTSSCSIYNIIAIKYV